MRWTCVSGSLRPIEADWLIVPVLEDATGSAAQEFK
jgi:hypothetical protein